jgi:xylose isomerase
MKHSICRWTFNPGKGGFVPAEIRPAWAELTTPGFVDLVAAQVRPRVPDRVELGVEMHYDNEVNEENAAEVADRLREHGMSLGLITPGAHVHWGYGGVASPDPKERADSSVFGKRTVDLAYDALKETWHPDAAPTCVLWNGSWGYDIPGPWLDTMLARLEDEVAGLIEYDQTEKGGGLYFGIEPKPNEGHPKMLLPTVASALLLRRRLGDRGIDVSKVGTNKEFGHSEMIGLDAVYDTAEELREGALVHVHANSQGYDGIRQGGPGMFDVDHGAAVTGPNLGILRMLLDAGYDRWVGHDMQPRPYDNEEQAVDRVVRSVINVEAMAQVAGEMDLGTLAEHLAARETGKVEDLVGDAISSARRVAAEMYAG